MAAGFHGSGSQSPTSISRTIEKVFDESQYTGEIDLSGRKLKEYPKCACKYDLVDITSAGKISVISPVEIISSEKKSIQFWNFVCILHGSNKTSTPFQNGQQTYDWSIHKNNVDIIIVTCTQSFRTVRIFFSLTVLLRTKSTGLHWFGCFVTLFVS